MELYSTFSLLLVVAALFAYLNQRFLRLPANIGLMTLTLLSSPGLVGLGRLGVPAVLRVVKVVRTIDFHTVLVQYMLSFLLFAGALALALVKSLVQMLHGWRICSSLTISNR